MTLPRAPVVIIPARLASTRLPGKPLLEIAGEPMIVHVWRRALEAGLGPVVVAAADPEIAAAVRAAGGVAMLTHRDHLSGSDRIFEALQAFDPEGRFDAVVNVQGDLPTIAPEAVRAVLAPLSEPEVEIGTVAAEIVREEEKTDPNVVKVAVAFTRGGTDGLPPIGRALYFSRAGVPSGPGPLYHHIGIYAYRRQALARFVRLPPGALEKRERLEQLRALEGGMRIDVARVDTVPLGVDTPAELARARAIQARRSTSR
ncbi:MAG: 3-deoxy-manno-octulosonate cytidylyltransferase [Pseudomonadota bacterium]